jgi:hypothetical protein
MIHSKTQIAAILGSVGEIIGLRIDRTGLGLVDPPAFTLGPPSLTWDDLSDTPTSTSYDGILYVPADDRAVARLLDWLPLVYAQIEAVEDAVVTAAAPQTFRVGSTDLPAYRLTIEVT